MGIQILRVLGMYNFFFDISSRLGAGQIGAAGLHLLSKLAKCPGGMPLRSSRLGGVGVKPDVASKKPFQSCGEGHSEKVRLRIAASRSWAACGYFDLS